MGVVTIKITKHLSTIVKHVFLVVKLEWHEFEVNSLCY